MRQKSNSTPASSMTLVRNIRRATRKHHATEEKIRIVLDGLRGERLAQVPFDGGALVVRQFLPQAHLIPRCPHAGLFGRPHRSSRPAPCRPRAGACRPAGILRPRVIHPLGDAFPPTKLGNRVSGASLPRRGRSASTCWRSRQHDGLDEEPAESEIGWVIDLITSIRSVRSE
jgi:hypothetical protein